MAMNNRVFSQAAPFVSAFIPEKRGDCRQSGRHDDEAGGSNTPHFDSVKPW
jgi:hypothetical protein